MDHENRSSDFILGVAMGVGSGLLAGLVVVAALVYFAPQFLGISQPSKSAHVQMPGDPAPASPFVR